MALLAPVGPNTKGMFFAELVDMSNLGKLWETSLFCVLKFPAVWVLALIFDKGRHSVSNNAYGLVWNQLRHENSPRRSSTLGSFF